MDNYWQQISQLTNPPRADGPVAHYSAGKNYYPQRYVVGWPEGIVKVGSTWNGRGRWGAFLCRGGTMLDLAYYGPEQSDIDAESWLQWQLRKRYPQAFNEAHEAAPYLGKRGAGYLECYKIPPDEWTAVIDLARTVDALV